MRDEYEVDLDGVRLSCSEFGSPEHPAVVLLHAAAQDRRAWDTVAEHLAARSWRVVTIDQRGHGTSSSPERYSFELMRDDVAGVIEARALAPAVVVGHSMGGTVATLLTERRPDLVRLLVLEDTPPPRPVDRKPAGRPDPPPANLPMDPRAWTAVMGQLADPDPAWWNDLELIAVPTLVVAGGPTSPIPQDELARAAARIPDGTLVTVDGAGHYVHREKEPEFLAALDAFLAEHPRGSNPRPSAAGS